MGMAFTAEVRRPVGRLILVIMLLAAVPAASGQQHWGVPGGLSEAFRPDVLRRDLALMAEDLGLDETQQEILASLYEDYETAFQAGTKVVRQALADLRAPRTEADRERERIDAELKRRYADLLEDYRRKRDALPPGGDDTDLRRQIQEQAEAIREQMGQTRPEPLTLEQRQALRTEASERIAAWELEKAALHASFVENVQAILVDEQRQRWPALERRLRRMRSLSRGQLSGESTNLLQIVRELRLEPPVLESIAPTLEAYEIELDAALRQRDAFMRSSERELAEAMSRQDREAAGAVIDRQVDQRRLVRDVNLDAADAITTVLPEPASSRFREAADERLFPALHRPTQAERLLLAAGRIDGLEPEAEEGIAALLEAFEADLRVHNEQLRQLIVLHEPDQLKKRSRMRISRSAPRVTGRVADDSIQSRFRQRFEMGQGYLGQLRGLLTPGQFEELTVIVRGRGASKSQEGRLRMGPGAGRTITPRKTPGSPAGPERGDSGGKRDDS